MRDSRRGAGARSWGVAPLRRPSAGARCTGRAGRVLAADARAAIDLLRSTARRWTASPCAPRTSRRARSCACSATSRPAATRWPRARDGRPDLHRRRDPARRRRGPAGRGRRAARRARSTPPAPRAGLHIRRRGEDVQRATCSRAPGDVLAVPRLPRWPRPGSRRRRARGAARRLDRHRQRAAARRARRPSRARSTSPTRWWSARSSRPQARGSSHHPAGRRRLRGDAGGDRAGPGGRRADRLRRRLGRPARPCQAGLRGVRRRRGLLARADQAGQAAVVRAPRRARSCSDCPATRCRRSSATSIFIVPALRRLRGERDAGPRLDRGRLGEPAGPLGRAHDVPDLPSSCRIPTACWSRTRPSARAPT